MTKCWLVLRSGIKCQCCTRSELQLAGGVVWDDHHNIRFDEKFELIGSYMWPQLWRLGASGIGIIVRLGMLVLVIGGPICNQV